MSEAANASSEPAKDTKTFSKPLYTQLATVNLRGDGRGPDGTPGEYEVTILFRHPIQPSGVDDKLPDAADEPGDSGIGIPGAVTLLITTGDKPAREVRVELRLNDSRRLAKAVSRLRAKTFGDARSTVASHVGPLLSRLVFESDGPIEIAQIDAVELGTGDKDLATVMRGRTRRFEGGFPEVRVAPPFFRSAFGIYREGLNSTNPFYALLCFFRIAEGALAYGSRQTAYAVAHDIDPTKPTPVVENIDDIANDFPHVVGWKCNRAAAWIEKEYRLAVAHGLNKVLHAPDELLERDRFWRVVPLARQVARKILEVEWQVRQRIGIDTIDELDK